MRRSIILMVVLVSTLTAANANTAIIWNADFYTFRYAVDKNGGTFIYPPQSYMNPSSDTQDWLHNPLQGVTAPYSATASGNLLEFPSPVPGEIRLRGMAKGPDGGVSPPRGIVVQGFTEVAPAGFTADHGIDIEQKVVCWISRRFSADSAGLYKLQANLAGVVSFTDFGSGIPFLGSHSVSGTLELLQSLDNWNSVQSIALFSVSEAVRDGGMDVNLLSNAAYELKAVLTIETKLLNYNWQSGAIQNLPAGTYRVGEATAPMVLNAIIYDPNEPELGLADSIKILQALAGLEPALGDLPGDLSGDGKLGLQEVIYGLQNAAGLR